jgi:GT2 family glycosyltransferase
MLLSHTNYDQNIKYKIAILISCYNRKEKTLACLESIFSQYNPTFEFTVYLIDCGSDGTSEAVKNIFPVVKLFDGNSNLYWAGSMRKIWQIAINTLINYDFYLLLNDDTTLLNNALNDLLYDFNMIGKETIILIGSTMDPSTNEISYGGNILVNKYGLNTKKILPNNQNPQICDVGNGNIMLVSKEVVNQIGILSDLYTHAFADFDYTLKAKKIGILSYAGSNYSGFCKNDHGNKWWSSKSFTLKERIKNLYDVKGLAYKEYLLFLKIHFPFFLPQAWIQLWAKTLLPILWGKFKK